MRRFFVIDETMGVKTAGEDLLAVTYARTIELVTAMTSSDNQRIYVPKMSISYASRDPSFEYVATDAVSFRATYTSSTDDYWDAFLGITCAVFCVAAVYWRYSIVKVSRRRQVLEPDATWAGHAVGNGANAIAFGSFVVLFWASGYFFTLYKAQTEVYVMVPLDGTSVVKEFEVFLDVAVAFAAIGVAHISTGSTTPTSSSWTGNGRGRARRRVRRGSTTPRRCQPGARCSSPTSGTSCRRSA